MYFVVRLGRYLRVQDKHGEHLDKLLSDRGAA